MLTLLHLYFPIIASAGMASDMKVTLFICKCREAPSLTEDLQIQSHALKTDWWETKTCSCVRYRRKIVIQTMLWMGGQQCTICIKVYHTCIVSQKKYDSTVKELSKDGD